MLGTCIINKSSALTRAEVFHFPPCALCLQETTTALVIDYIFDAPVPCRLTDNISRGGGMMHSWPDVEGASFIRTLGKAWGEDAPAKAFRLCVALIARSSESGAPGSAAAGSGALTVAYLLPALLKCVESACTESMSGNQLRLRNSEPAS